MLGQATITIRDKQWQVSIADTSWELAQGLSGIPGLPAGTGMFFDMGWEQTVQVTTVPMLFSLDIAFFSEEFVVTEVYRNIEPGYMVTATLPARYFLEVNAGELEGIDSGDRALIELLPLEEVPVIMPDWVSTMISLMGFVVMGILTISIAQDLVKGMFGESEKTPALLPQTKPGAGFKPGEIVHYKGERVRVLNHVGDRVSIWIPSRQEEVWIKPEKLERIIRGSPEGKPTGTCYADAWRFLIKEEEGELIHGTVFSGGRRMGHAWVETPTGYIWEPETGKYFTLLGFKDAFAPVVESRYTAEEAAIMAARTKNLGPWAEEERRQYLKEKSPPIIPEHPRQPRHKDEIEFLPDSPEFLSQTIDAIGYRDRLDSTFQKAIARAKGLSDIYEGLIELRRWR